MVSERQKSEENLLKQRMEIDRLQQALTAARLGQGGVGQRGFSAPGNSSSNGSSGGSNSNSSNQVLSMSNGADGRTVIRYANHTASFAPSSHSSSHSDWFNPLGFIGYWLTGGSGGSSSNTKNLTPSVIIQV
jgi:hypothetical protein